MKDMKKDSFRSILEGIPLATLGSLIFAVAVAFFMILPSSHPAAFRVSRSSSAM